MRRTKLNFDKFDWTNLAKTAAVAILLAGGFPARSMCQQQKQKTFSSAEDASNALVTAAQNNDEKATLDILGPDGKRIVSSGDDGAQDCSPSSDQVAVNALAASPHAVAVGGTSLFVQFDTSGNVVQYLGETVWNDDHGAGGGGQSTVFARPRFQIPLDLGFRGRVLPDLALAQQNKPAVAYAVLERHGLTDSYNAMRAFPGGWQRRGWHLNRPVLLTMCS